MEGIEQLNAALRRSDRWMGESADLIDGLNFDMSLRQRVAISFFHLAMQHQQGIHVTVENTANSSASALYRPLIESYVRGVWYLTCATDAEVEGFLNDREPPGLSFALNALGRVDPDGLGRVEAIFKPQLRKLHDLTHGGLLQFAMRNAPAGINAVHPPDELAKLLASTAAIACLACIGIARAIDSVDLAERVGARFRDIYEEPAG